MIENQRSIDFDPASIDPLVLTVVRTASNRLAGSYGFSYNDRDDIRQELLLDCFVRLRRFNAARSNRRTFVYRVVRNRVATLCASQTAACRDYRLRHNSLDDSQSVGNQPIPLRDHYSAADCADLRRQSALSYRERDELRIDVARVTARLPLELAAIAMLLTSVGASEAAKQLGIPRATLYRRIADIRVAFRNGGLDRYLGRSGRASVRRSGRSSAFCQSGRAEENA